MKYVDVPAPGGPEALRIAEAAIPTPADGEILIRVAAAGVNRPDILQRQGKYPPPPGASPVLGLEVAGTVETAGAHSRWQPGDAVCALVHGGGYAGFCVAPDPQCLPLPRGLSIVQAAGIPETFPETRTIGVRTSRISTPVTSVAGRTSTRVADFSSTALG